MTRRLALALSLLACAIPVASAHAAQPLLVGAAEDAPKQSTVDLSLAKLRLAQLAGLNAIRVTALWEPTLTDAGGDELTVLQNAARAAQLTGVRLYVSVYPSGGRVAPHGSTMVNRFARYVVSLAQNLQRYGVRDYIVGNEPNLNRFWLPQFTPAGKDAATPAYMTMLAATYDALKAWNPGVNVIGGAVSPRGSDDPKAPRKTHSPTTFIQHMGQWYRGSGRTRPVMDQFSFHPYLESSKLPPTFTHSYSRSISIADYDKLVALLGQAFDNTAQAGTTMPIVYDEFGVQSTIVAAKKRHYRFASSPAARDAVPEDVQASYYVQALQLAACQPTVEGLFLFHVSDEHDMRAWQSGLYYSDDTPKSSLTPVRDAAEAARAGSLTDCDELSTTPGAYPTSR